MPLIHKRVSERPRGIVFTLKGALKRLTSSPDRNHFQRVQYRIKEVSVQEIFKGDS